MKNIPKDANIYSNGRYFIAVFKSQKAKKEIFKSDLDDMYFDGFLVENLRHGSRVVIEAKSGYNTFFRKEAKNIVVNVKKVKKTKRQKIIQATVPKDMIATPFYISESVFIKKRNQTTQSYDETLFFTGVKMLANRNYGMAMEFFKEIIKKHPNSKFYLSSYFLLGDCYKNKKEYNKAIETYKKAIRLSPKNDAVAQTLISIADIWISKQYYSKARDIYKSIIKDYATTKWGKIAKFLIAKTYYDQKLYKKAVARFVEVDKNSEYYPLALLLAGECFIKQKDDARAVLAYYSMSKYLNRIDILAYHKELLDVAEALCKFNDYNAARTVFRYVESSKNQDIIEQSFIGRMKCDLLSGDYDDLSTKADFIINGSKDKDRIKEAKKLLDKAKLKSGKVDKKTIDEILNRYSKQPDIVSLALYVYAKKSYRNKRYKEALDYLLKLKKLYPASKYNKEAEPIASDSINKLVDDLYKDPNKQKLEFIYDSVTALNAYKADMCRIAVALIAFKEIDRLSKILPYAKDQNCKKVLYAKYYIEKGYDKNALEALDDVDKVKPYINYVNMVMGDINYFKGSYEAAFEFYKKALDINEEMLKDYVRIKVAQSLMQAKKYKLSLKYLNIESRLYPDKILYIKALDYYNLGEYKKDIVLFKQLLGNLEYKEESLFYITISYLKLKDKKMASEYLDKLKKQYPKSRYLKTLKVLF